MIKVISFDLGGVLFTEGKKVLTERLEHRKGYDPDVINTVLVSDPSLALRRGRITEDEFWEYAESVLPEGYDAGLIRSEWQDCYLIDNDIFDLVKQLHKAGSYRLLTFSVNVKNRIPYLDKKFGFRQYFDGEVYSFDHGALKWEKPFFEALLNEADVPADQILHIDDHLKYTNIARELGMNVLIYKIGEIANLRKGMQSYGIELVDG